MANEKQWDQLFRCCYLPKPNDVAYIYDMDAERRPVRPYLLKCYPTNDLVPFLQHEYGGGTYRIIIRRGI